MVMMSRWSDVAVCLPRPMEGMGRLQFSDLFTELPVPPQSFEHFNVLFIIYHSEHYGLIFGPFKEVYLI